jgi:hypothetical protein
MPAAASLLKFNVAKQFLAVNHAASLFTASLSTASLFTANLYTASLV